jgi:hypothetical protein
VTPEATQERGARQQAGTMVFVHLRLAPFEPLRRPGCDEFFETTEQTLGLFFHNEERAVLRLEKTLIDRVI